MKSTDSIRQWFLQALCGLAGWALTCPLPGQAVTTNVNVVSFAFNPPAVTINANDTVKWTFTTEPHSSTSTSALAPVRDTGTTNPVGYTFSVTFPTAGSYPYICTIHAALFNMRGSVTVQAAANVPPTVTVTNPPNGAVLSAPATITLAASASDSDGSVTNVQFLQGAASLANDTSSPYSVVVNNLGAGDYTFSAVAADNGGLRATNAIVVHVVTPVAIVLSAPQRVSASAFQFSYSASPGLKYAVFRSGSLPGLTPISTNTATSSTVSFLDNSATGAMNFYSVHLVPNP
jgi:plastocyanin